MIDRDRARGLALVTGSAAALRACTLLERPGHPARWSHVGRGYVVDDFLRLELRGYAQAHRLVLVERDRGRPP